MVVGVAMGVVALGAAKVFQGAVGDDLVGVHVGGGAGPALDAVHRELVEEASGDEVVAGPADGLADGGGNGPELHVGQGGGLFDVAQGGDEFRAAGYGLAAYGEVLHGAQGLDAVVDVVGDLHLS